MKAGGPLSSDGLSASQRYNQHRQPPPSTQIIHPMSRIPSLTHLVLSPCFSIIENFSYFPHPPPSLRLVRRSHVGRSDEKVSSCCRLAICSPRAWCQWDGKKDNCPILSQRCFYDTLCVSPQSEPSREETVSTAKIINRSPIGCSRLNICINASETSQCLRCKLQYA